MPRRLLVVVAVAGCSSGGPTSIVVEVDAGELAVQTLFATIVTGARSDGCVREPLAGTGRAVDLPGRLVVLLPDATTDAFVSLAGQTAGGCAVSAAGHVDIGSGEQKTLSLAVTAEYPLACCDGMTSPGETARDCGGPCPACDLASDPPGWRDVLDPIAVRDHLAAVAGHDGRIYQIAGEDTGGHLASIESLDPIGGSGWELASEEVAPPRIRIAAAVAPDGTIHVAGGDAGAGPVADHVAIAADGTVAARAPLVTARSDLALVTGVDAVYAIGGSPSGTNATADVERYDPATDQWTVVHPMSTPRRAFGAAFGDDGRLYAFGGYDGTSVWLDSAEAYSSPANQWAALAPLPIGREGVAGTAGSDGRIYAIGGDYAAGSLNEVVAYTARSDRWSPVASLAAPRSRSAAVTGCDGRLYVIGGALLGPPYTPVVGVYGPNITLDPPFGRAGTTVRVRGDGFATGAGARAFFATRAGDTSGTGTTDATGVLSQIDVVVPDVGPGLWPITVVDDRSRMLVTTLFEVVAE